MHDSELAKGLDMNEKNDSVTSSGGALLEAALGHVGHELETFQEAVEDFQDSSQEWRRLFSESSITPTSCATDQIRSDGPGPRMPRRHPAVL